MLFRRAKYGLPLPTFNALGGSANSGITVQLIYIRVVVWIGCCFLPVERSLATKSRPCAMVTFKVGNFAAAIVVCGLGNGHDGFGSSCCQTKRRRVCKKEQWLCSVVFCGTRILRVSSSGGVMGPEGGPFSAKVDVSKIFHVQWFH